MLDKVAPHLTMDIYAQNYKLNVWFQLSGLNEKMSELPVTGTTAMIHTLQRHRDILNVFIHTCKKRQFFIKQIFLKGYRQEYNKIEANHTTRIEREELLRGSDIGGSITPSNSVLNRRDMYLKESTHVHK